MQSIIITNRLLSAQALHASFKRLNIDTICTRPQSLEAWYPETDAVICIDQIKESDFHLHFDFFKELSHEIPIIFLNQQSDVFYEFFKEQSSRFVTLPPELSLEEISRLIQDLIQQSFDSYHEQILCGPICLNKRLRNIEILGKSVRLTKKEFYLMELLTKNLGKIITRDRIIDYVWDSRKYVASNTIDVYVSRLRKKLQSELHSPVIKTIPCLGYSLHLN